MFVPKGPIPSAASLRNARRRQRTDSDESVKLPTAKRQRSALRQETSESPLYAGDGETRHEPPEVSVPVQKDEFSPISSDGSGTQKRIAIRGARKPEQPEDGVNKTIILSKTDYYVVSQLPALPDQFRGLQLEPCKCFFGPGHRYALALTHSHAVVWPYSISDSSPFSVDACTVLIPESCRDPNGPVPLGVLLSTATAELPGLMVIIPSTGRIIYWETISSASSLGLSKQKQNGLQGSIPGLFSGEYVKDVISGEPSGIVVTFSSGRVAQITVKDSQGKPSVIVNFLRNTVDSGRGGLLGGIKNVLGGGIWRKDVAAARAGSSHQRGQRDIIIATSTGLFEIWDTHWHNGSVLKRQFDIGSDIFNALGRDYVDGTGQTDLRILDFVVAAGQYVNAHDSQVLTEESWPLLVLVGPARRSDSTKVSVVRVNLSGKKTDVLSTHSVSVHSVPAKQDELQPRLFASGTGDTAFILMGSSVTLLSLATFGEPPSLQPLSLSNHMPGPFQDSIHFRNGKEYEILGRGFEDQSGQRPSPTCLIMVRGFGVIRITALPRQITESEIEEAQITAKDKLEQAVFYGSMMGNPLNLVSKGGLEFPDQEIERAALDISRELLRSSSKSLSNAVISLDQHLRLRAKALDDLISLLLQHGIRLSRLAWWELLWGAEKLAAQRAMCKIEESFRNKNGEPTFLTRVIEQMSDKFKTKIDARHGEVDPVRQWFIHDSYRMEHIIPWICNAVKPKKGNPSFSRVRRMPEQILQASELSLAILETAFQYRDEHARLYASNEGILEDGVLTAGYQDLPEFWTSRNIVYVETGHLLDFELDNCRAWIHHSASTTDAPDAKTVRKIAQNSARHIRVLGQMHRERDRWLSSHGDSKLVDERIAAEQAYVKRRKWQLFKLAGIGQLDDAINLAETFRDMSALVELIIELQDQTRDPNSHHVSTGDISDVVISEVGQCSQKISLYFDRFGESWADAFFSRQISMGQSGVLLAMRRFQAFITRFLRKTPAYSRLSWINDVIGENDYNAASRSLENLAIEHESDIWSHHVELSLAKLTRLAAAEKAPSLGRSSIQNDVDRLNNYAAIDAVQEMVYEYILPVLHGAIDQKAAIELAISHFGKSVLTDRPSLHEVLGDALAKVVTRQFIGVDEVVDLLTLIDPVHFSECHDSGFLGQEFFLALRVVHLSCYPQTDPSYHIALQKLTWKRCMIRDNWEAIVETISDTDGDVGANPSIYSTALFRTLSLCSREGVNNLSLKSFSPSEILSTTSDSDILSSRFPSHQRARILRDLEKENEILRQYVDKGNLEIWFQNLAASARTAGASPISVNSMEPSSG